MILRRKSLLNCPAAVQRVALVLDRMERGGKEQVVIHLATEFAEAGLKPMVICLRDRGHLGRRLAGMGVPVEAVRSSRSWDFRGIVRLAGLLRRFRPDVINVHDRSSLSYTILASRLIGGCPVVLSCHGLLFRQKERSRLPERLALREVAAVTAVSREVARDYAELLEIAGPVEVIHNGVRLFSRCPQVGQAMRNELGVSEGVFLFVAVGNVKPEKGYEDLLEACECLRRRKTARPFVVAVAGAASDETYLKSIEWLLAKLGLESTVRFIGYQEDTLALYSAADAFVLSSRTEGLPMALLEAMSIGLPVVATAVGGVPNVLEESGAGLLVEPANPASLAGAMGELLGSRHLCGNMGLRGMKLVRKRYGAVAMARNYLKAYCQAAGPLRGGNGLSAGSKRRRVGVLMLGPMPPLTGGMATVVQNLRESSLARGCRLTVMNNGKRTKEGRSALEGFVSQIGLVLGLVGSIVRSRAQIVHIHSCSGFTFWRDCAHALVGRLLGSRIVWHVHGGKFDEFGGSQNVVGKTLMRLMLEHASAVIVLSEDWIGRLGPLAPSARWRVVPNGVPIPEGTGTAEKDTPVFLFLGNLGEEKGARDLVQAGSIACRKGFDGRIELAGDETEPGGKDKLEREIAESGCDSHVRLVGVLSGEAKKRALSEAACVVLPSYAEGLPMALLEGMAYGLPVIATKVGAIPEVVTDGREGFLVEAGDIHAIADCMLKLSRDPELRRRMGMAARHRAETRYSLDTMIEKITQIYREVLKQEPVGS